MNMDPNWPRWIAASLAIYFKAIADSSNIEFMVDGIDERSTDVTESDHAELRLTGPFITEPSSGWFVIDVDTNILLVDLMETGDNSYNLMTWAGVFQEAARKPINVYRYGPDTGGVDDGSWVGCLKVRDDKDGSRTLHFGQQEPENRVRQSAVDTRHRMELFVTTG